MASFYGHPSLFALKSSQGYLCSRWWASDNNGVLLFTDPKIAKEWLKEAGKIGHKLDVVPTSIRQHGEGLKPAINPSKDVSDIQRVISHLNWQNW